MITILQGNVLDVLPTLPAGSFRTCVTSPPYWGLRDYGVPGQLGLEPDPDEYLETMVKVFREVRRVLTKDGTCWVNMGDCYVTGTSKTRPVGNRGLNGKGTKVARSIPRSGSPFGLAAKQMVGMPWRLAFALQADGWFLRQDIIWHKPNPMPEAATDRCTKAHEYIFLLSKSKRYYYDAKAISEPTSGTAHLRRKNVGGWDTRVGTPHDAREYQQAKNHRKLAKPNSGTKQNASFDAAVTDLVAERNKRSVWTIPSHPFTEAHFATFPPALIRPCILAGAPMGGGVLDPFGGSGTTGEVAEMEGRNATLIELNPEYVKIIERRTAQRGLFAS